MTFTWQVFCSPSIEESSEYRRTLGQAKNAEDLSNTDYKGLQSMYNIAMYKAFRGLFLNCTTYSWSTFDK